MKTLLVLLFSILPLFAQRFPPGALVSSKAAAAAGGGSIAFDAASTATAVVNASSITWSHTCTGTDRALIVAIGFYDASVTVSGVTYNGVAMTEEWDTVDTTFSAARSAGYSLAAPATGANNIVVTFSAAADVGAAGASSWTGVQQSDPTRTAYTANGYDDTNPYGATVTVVDSASGDVVVDSVFTFTPTVVANLTTRSETDNAGGDNKSHGHQSTAASGASTVMSWNIGAESTWVIGAISLIPE